MPSKPAATATQPVRQEITSSSTTIRVTIPDPILDGLEADVARTGRSLDAVVTERLRPTTGFRLGDRLLILDASTRAPLEDLLGPLPNAQELVKAVRNLVTFSLQDVKLTLEPWQIEEIGRRAARNGTSMQEEMDKAVKLVREMAFHGIPR